MSQYLRDQDTSVSLVLCSSALRARETVERVSPPGEIRIEPELYGASASELLARLRRLPDEVESVMLVGHNPAMQQLAVGLAAGSELAQRKFPTGGLATLSFEGAWHALERGTAELEAFVVFRELG